MEDVIREIYYYGSGYDFYYFRVKYSNYKTGELLMIVQTELYTVNTNITYFSDHKIIKTESHTVIKYDPQAAGSQAHMYSYYKNGNLLSACIISPCKISSIQLSGDDQYFSFDQCPQLRLMTRIGKNRFSPKAMRKADKFWTKQK